MKLIATDLWNKRGMQISVGLRKMFLRDSQALNLQLESEYEVPLALANE
jgi:hypothetical protein